MGAVRDPLRVDVSLAPDPVIEAYKKDVDRTLLRENLKLTPEQRLQKLQAFVDFPERLARRAASSGVSPGFSALVRALAEGGVNDEYCVGAAS